MSLAPRFPDTITRIRETPGHRNEFGEWQAGTTEEQEFPASVQPVLLEDLTVPEGERLSHRLKLYVPHSPENQVRGFGPGYGPGFARTRQTGAVSNALLAAFDDQGADKVRIGTAPEVYEVVESQSWRSHTRAIVLRET